jgi:hypothetical protein
MMQYLTSILSRNRSSNSKKEDSERKIQDLENRIADLEKSQQEVIACIQHLAASISAVVMHAADQKKDPLDEILDNLPGDDGGSGYLH